MLQRFVERGKETVLAILEDLIERAARDTRAADDMRDAYVRSATLGDLLYHRGEHTRALQLSYLLVPVRVCRPNGASSAPLTALFTPLRRAAPSDGAFPLVAISFLLPVRLPL